MPAFKVILTAALAIAGTVLALPSPKMTPGESVGAWCNPEGKPHEQMTNTHSSPGLKVRRSQEGNPWPAGLPHSKNHRRRLPDAAGTAEQAGQLAARHVSEDPVGREPLQARRVASDTRADGLKRHEKRWGLEKVECWKHGLIAGHIKTLQQVACPPGKKKGDFVN